MRILLALFLMTTVAAAEMRYVQRDPKTKEIIGHYANWQAYAQEMLPADSPEIRAWAEKQKRLREVARRDHRRSVMIDEAQRVVWAVSIGAVLLMLGYRVWKRG